MTYKTCIYGDNPDEIVGPDELARPWCSAVSEVKAGTPWGFCEPEVEREVEPEPVTCDGIYDGDETSGCFTLTDEGECIISNPTCQSLICTDTHMTGSFRASLIGLDSNPGTPSIVNNAACNSVTYDDTLDII